MKASNKKECDLVMKGGITSGVIYPKLIARLSQEYNFRSIGGTSAGAIAAAAAAAAQLGVVAGTNSNAFEELDALPKQLGESTKTPGRKGSVLLNLFQPQKQTSRHFGAIQEQIDALSASLHKQQNPTYGEIVLDNTPPSYKFKPGHETHAHDLLQALDRLSKALRDAGVDLSIETPEPKPESRIVPRI